MRTNTDRITSWNARSLAPEQILALRVDRDEELALCVEAILQKGDNIALYGERGVGKTFLIRLVQSEIPKVDPSVLAFYASMNELPAYSPNDISAAFPRAVLLQICSGTWKTLFKKSYLSLRERLKESGNEITSRSSAERTIQRIYTHLMRSAPTSTYQFRNLVGFSAGAKGEKEEKGSVEQRQSDILPFEFLEFIDEINSAVCDKYAKSRIVVLCDEATYLSEFDQNGILQRYVELFSTSEYNSCSCQVGMCWRRPVLIFLYVLKLYTGFVGFLGSAT